ncbi:MAG TPA: hypothetical protein VNM47_14425 [Terriglobia bacterium]|nr:hypothetical protein [Terriglobia bacterium]
MRNLRIEKAMALRIGETGPNILIPIAYGSIDRHLKRKVETEIDRAVDEVCKREKIEDKELTRILAKYQSLPHQVKRYWSGDDYEKLMTVRTFSEASDRFNKLEEEFGVVGKYRKYRGVAATPRKSAFAGRQPSRIDGVVKPEVKCCCCCCVGTPSEQPGVPESPTNPPPEKPPENRYSWEFGPHLKCLDEFEDHWYGNLGDDLYAAFAYGDGAGEVKTGMIPKTDGTNDLDPGETGTWPFPQRLIYPPKAPKGYLHIEIDIWEKDYSAEFFGGLLSILGVVAGPIGAALGAPAIGAVAGKALEGVRSQISDNDDDNYLGKLVFDYPQGETDLHTFIGSRTTDWSGNDCRYLFDYVIRELAP